MYSRSELYRNQCAPRTSANRSRVLPFRRRFLPSFSRHLRRSLDVTELILLRGVHLASTANFHANSSGRAFRSKISRVTPVAILSLHLHFHLLFLSSSFCFATILSAGATFLPKLYELSFHSSQLLCWELTGQHPISNKACHHEVVSLQLIHPCLP